MTDNTRHLSHAISRRVRELRDAAGISADAVASAARRIGLGWHRSTVAALEAGDRRLTADEFLLLPAVLRRAGCGVDRLDELLPTGEGTTPVADGARIETHAARDLVRKPVDTWSQALDTPERRALAETDGEDHADWLRRVAQQAGLRPGVEQLEDKLPATAEVLGGAAAADGLALIAGPASAELTAARRLNVGADEILEAAAARWGRSLTEEREARLTARLPDSASPRTAQAVRGHITRELLDELAAQLQED